MLGSSTGIGLSEKPHISMPPQFFCVDYLGILPSCSLTCQSLGYILGTYYFPKVANPWYQQSIGD